jgi:cell fate (sporulation/competence/biofilm development) regulator YlbF (YheA/YmcA/DUF963 family)
MEIMELAAKLGQAIKADSRIAKMNEAREAYEKDEKIQALMMEYEAQQNALAEAYKLDPVDSQVIAAIEGRLQGIVAEVTTSESFVNINKAQEEVNALMQEVNEEIEFQITGQRPSCTHDCSTCGAGCSHNH